MSICTRYNEYQNQRVIANWEAETEQHQPQAKHTTHRGKMPLNMFGKPVGGQVNSLLADHNICSILLCHRVVK